MSEIVKVIYLGKDSKVREIIFHSLVGATKSSKWICGFVKRNHLKSLKDIG